MDGRQRSIFIRCDRMKYKMLNLQEIFLTLSSIKKFLLKEIEEALFPGIIQIALHKIVNIYKEHPAFRRKWSRWQFFLHLCWTNPRLLLSSYMYTVAKARSKHTKSKDKRMKLEIMNDYHYGFTPKVSLSLIHPNFLFISFYWEI